MAKQHTKGNGVETTNGDIPVVAPINMGKGLLWDESTGTYYVAVDDRSFELDELGRLKLRVSTLEDNQLQIRNDGVYQGETAEQSDWYVDSRNGNDETGKGTRDAPYRTVMQAIKQFKSAYKYHIWLEENGTYVLDNSFDLIVNRVWFSPYGASWDTAFEVQGAGLAYAALSNAVKRPILTFALTKTGTEFLKTVYRAMTLSVVNTGNNLHFYGLDIRLAPYPTDYPRALNYPTYLGDSNLQRGIIEFTGCDIDVPKDYVFISNVQNLVLVGNIHKGEGKVWHAPNNVLPSLITHHQIAEGDVAKFPTSTGQFRVNSTLEETLKRLGGWNTPVVNPTIVSNVPIS